MQDALKDAQSQADRVREAMAPSIAQQRESVKRQIETVSARVVRPVPSVNATWNATCDPIAPPELTRMIDETSHRVGIDAGLVREVARQESGFRPCAVSPKGAEGLMQLMPATQNQFAVSDPFDPKESLDAGGKLLKQLLDRYQGNLPLALSAYNAGAACVDSSGGVPNIPETRNYVLSILAHATGFESAPLEAALATTLSTSAGCQPAKSEKPR